jgi:hypothetical protein
MKTFAGTAASATCLALTLAGCGATAAPAPVPAAVSAVPGARAENAPDLGSLIKRFLSPQGFMDPAFPPTVAMPSRYLGDFFGMQAIQDIPRDRILADFAALKAEKTAEDANSVTFRMPAGYTARFFPISTLAVAGQNLPVSHVEISGDTWQTLGKNLADFRGLLKTAKLESAYLIPNKFYEDEVVTYRQMQKGSPTPITTDASGAAFAKSRNGILLIPEGVHGRPEDVAIAIEMLKTTRPNWIGLEMLGTDQQPMLDAFNAARKGTPAYDDARAKLAAYFATAWNGRAGPKTSGEENLYFKLAEAAHAAGTRVIGIEGSSIEYLLLRYGETQFGAAVRNLWWANALPKTGTGIIFGGSAHFNAGQPVNVQDFMVVNAPGRPVFSLKDIKMKAAG